jgi:hypothetical protein
MSTISSSLAVHVTHLWNKVLDLGPYAGEQFALELVQKSTAALDLLQRYAELPAELCRAYGTVAPRIWLLED